ncbi:MAG TPA: M23 family metallopeptidase, partial [Phenylobacterium sp.]|nr:M23 family metallopeptidase [Phenylobacterium sp.]
MRLAPILAPITAPIIALAAAALCAPAALAQAPASTAPPKLGFPLACQIGKTCEVQHYVDRDPGPGMADYHCGRRTEPQHTGVDIRLPDMAAQRRGVAVLAAAAGRVVRVRDGVADISVRKVGVASVDKIGCGNAVVVDNGGGWTTAYCHLANGSVSVKPGDHVAAGHPLGRVGLSGLTEFPHLHFEVRHDNAVVDPFAPAPGANPSCGALDPLWTPAALNELAYKAGDLMIVGLSGDRSAVERMDEGTAPPLTAAAPVMVIYVRAIGLEAGDQIEMRLLDPQGRVIADSRAPALPSYKDQYDIGLAHARPPAGW